MGRSIFLWKIPHIFSTESKPNQYQAIQVTWELCWTEKCFSLMMKRRMGRNPALASCSCRHFLAECESGFPMQTNFSPLSSFHRTCGSSYSRNVVQRMAMMIRRTWVGYNTSNAKKNTSKAKKAAVNNPACEKEFRKNKLLSLSVSMPVKNSWLLPTVGIVWQLLAKLKMILRQHWLLFCGHVSPQTVVKIDCPLRQHRHQHQFICLCGH